MQGINVILGSAMILSLVQINYMIKIVIFKPNVKLTKVIANELVECFGKYILLDKTVCGDKIVYVFRTR